MGYYDVRNAKISILDMLKFDAVQDTDGVICKEMGTYVEMLVPMKNAKGHDTYKVYFTDNGNIENSLYGTPSTLSDNARLANGLAEIFSIPR